MSQAQKLEELKAKFQAEFGNDPQLWDRFSRHVQLAAKGVYHTTPVSPRKFFTDPYYCGKDIANTLFPAVLEALEETCSGRYVEAVLTGGIGCSKTTIALLGMMYQVYVLSCMHNPQRAFGLMQSDEIVFIFQSLAAHLAKDISFDRFRARLDESQYFQTKFPYNKDLKSVIAFPKRIIVKAVSGSDKAAISQNVFGGVIDEVNFMAVIKGSTKSIDGGVFDQAQALYDSIRRRRESRFMNQGELPGILFLVSSKRYPGQFTDRKAEEARREKMMKGKTGIYIYDKRIWDVQPHKFSSDRFKVFTGDQSRQPFLYKPDEKPRAEDEHLVLEVPLEYRMSFEMDILGSLRDIGGTSTLALHPFIMDTSKVASCFGTIESVISRESCDFTTTHLEIYPELFKYPDEPRFVHIDLAYRGDSAGVACAHIQHFQQIHRTPEYAEVLPVIGFDFVLEVLPPRGGEIVFAKIRMLIVKLRDLGLNIRWVTLDSFQSRDTIQILRTAHFMTGLQSVDTTALPYTILKSAFMDLRVRAPTHPRAQGELIQLEQDERTGKIDHPPDGSKDCSDAMAGAAYGVATRRDIWARHDVLHLMPQDFASVRSGVSDGRSVIIG